MVNNFERICHEIKKEANLNAPTHKLDVDAIFDVIMEVVELEDQHRIRRQSKIDVKVKSMIEKVSNQPL